jgi:hypothetical protein
MMVRYVVPLILSLFLLPQTLHLDAQDSAVTNEIGRPPAEGFRDAARILSPELQQRLARELPGLRDRSGVHIYVETLTFLPVGVTLFDRAKALRQTWLAEVPGLVFVQARTGATQPTIQVSPALWELYTQGRLAAVLKDISLKVNQGPRDPAGQAETAIVALLDGLARLEKWRGSMLSWWERMDLRLAVPFAVFLVLSATIVRWISSRRASREKDRQNTFLFPDVQVAERLGAPHGGGVVAEINYRT